MDENGRTPIADTNGQNLHCIFRLSSTGLCRQGIRIPLHEGDEGGAVREQDDPEEGGPGDEQGHESGIEEEVGADEERAADEEPVGLGHGPFPGAQAAGHQGLEGERVSLSSSGLSGLSVC